jgi:hypothetical protein
MQSDQRLAPAGVAEKAQGFLQHHNYDRFYIQTLLLLFPLYKASYF